ncbi:hypothetical protein Pth03_21980 [Planotetraspora thailandica]|uniref:DUF998 domain-containing protein n=1 Tax=Planotetraspora thailandica TaxID=487172 RepID=A0A8J3XV08_9ACTN|nr:DUF998 domain-containing protein [Planotetraspora thailandica]GII53809.1 hypothetical protein Pth03_21980 [Planotetraspora thailandica]
MVKRLYPVIACAGILFAVISVVAAQVNAGPTLDPVTMTISEFASRYDGFMIETAMAVLGLSSLALVAGLRAVRAPIDGWPAALMTVWSGSLVAAAIVPGSAAGAHLALSVPAFVSIPVAAVQLAGRLGADARWSATGRVVEWLALVAGIALAAITYVALPGHGVMIGLVERLLLTAEVSILFVLAVRLLRLTWAAVPREMPAQERHVAALR